MKTYVMPIIAALSLAGCQQSTTTASFSGASASSISATAISSDSAASKFVNATAIAFDEIIPTPGSKHVTVHAFPRLRAEPSCARVLSVGFSSHHSYPDTMVALKNRAALLGANALAGTNWIESSTHMYMVTHFYHCNSKKNI